MFGVEIPQTVKVCEFGAHAAYIVPTAAEDRIDFGFGFFGEGSDEIGTPNTIFWKEPANTAGNPRGKISHPVGVRQPHTLEKRDGERADQRIACALKSAA